MLVFTILLFDSKQLYLRHLLGPTGSRKRNKDPLAATNDVLDVHSVTNPRPEDLSQRYPVRTSVLLAEESGISQKW